VGPQSPNYSDFQGPDPGCRPTVPSPTQPRNARPPRPERNARNPPKPLTPQTTCLGPTS